MHLQLELKTELNLWQLENAVCENGLFQFIALHNDNVELLLDVIHVLSTKVEGF